MAETVRSILRSEVTWIISILVLVIGVVLKIIIPITEIQMDVAEIKRNDVQFKAEVVTKIEKMEDGIFINSKDIVRLFERTNILEN